MNGQQRPATVLISTPPFAGLALAYGACGGVFAGLAALVPLMIGANEAEHAPPAALNAIGAWAVRWLQEAAPQALDEFYMDATLGGLASLLILAALAGMIFAAFLERMPEDHPFLPGLLFGCLSWIFTVWFWLPALNPLLLKEIPSPWLFVAHLVFGWVIGLWIQAGRTALNRSRLVV